MGYGPAMTPDYRPSLVRSFERHLRAENRSEHTIASYLESPRQAEAFLAGRGRSLVDARRDTAIVMFLLDTPVPAGPSWPTFNSATSTWTWTWPSCSARAAASVP